LLHPNWKGGENEKYATKELQRIITIGETTADAPRPLFGTTENAIPRTVEQALPRITSQVKFHQSIGSVGRLRSKTTEPKNSNNMVCTIIKIVTSKCLTNKV
jgi:hypothetical protein